MTQRLEQTQATIQTQQLATLQVAVAKMVELSVAELENRVQDEMLENAALEEKDNDDFLSNTPADNDDTDNDSNGEDNEDNDNSTQNDDNAYEETEFYGSEADAMGDYFSADDVPDYLQQRAEEQRDRNELQYSGSTSFYEELQNQISEHDLNEHEREVMEYIIGSLDEDGFLRKDLEALTDELAIYHNILTSTDELERLIGILQEFEPRGIGARSLQECLHIQLTDPERRTPYTETALEVIDHYFKEFTSRHWEIIRQRLELDSETEEHVKYLLTHLNPRPGSALNETSTLSAPVVMPDFFVSISDDGRPRVTLNQGDVPELQISRSFADSLQQYGRGDKNLTREQKDAYTYAGQKVDAAKNFINLIQRRHDTLLAVMRAIVAVQTDFFTNEDDDTLLKPLALKDIAEKVEMDISTVSRVTSTKYVQTAYGMYPLKFFFSLQFTTSDGDELSAREVKAALKQLVEEEDKHHPLADEALAAELKKRGYNVARRTVAKYRDMLNIPSTRLRKIHG